MSQNVLYVTINLPDIQENTLQLDLQPTKVSFKAKAGECVGLSCTSPRAVN